MAIEFKVPELGENIQSGDVVKVLVQEGQTIAANDGVIELETDKAVIEIPCPHAGKITKLAVKKGQSVKVGQTLLVIESEEGDEAQAAPQPAAGRKHAQKPEPGKQAPTAAESAVAEDGGPETKPSPPIPLPKRERGATPAQAASGPTPAGPAARRLAREQGVDIGGVAGSGKHGRITPDDIMAAAHGAKVADVAGSTRGATTAVEPYQPVTPPGEPGTDAWGEIRRDRLSKIRQTIAAQMVKSASTIPHVTNFDDADVTELEAMRKAVPPGFLGANIKLTTMPFVLRAVALALRRHPLVNASLDEQNQQIVYKQYVNLGVAVDTPRGLVVPVLRDVDQMPLLEIASQLADLAKRARAAQFAVEELRGGTFTISNLGAVGGTYSTPIINHPEVAILLLGRSRLLPVVREGRIEPRMMMPLSLSYDHRLVDGAAAARFLNEVIDFLQSPAKLLLLG